MIELVGLLYGIGKDIVTYLQWSEEIRAVDLPWLEKSGLKQLAEKDGLELVWSKSKKAESRILDGYEIFYEIDKIKRVRRKIIVKDSAGNEDLVLMAKPK